MVSPRLAIAALTALTLVRLVAAAAVPLSPDEVYYWVWSRALAAGYLDHPPMVALWIRAGAALAAWGPAGLGIGGDGALGIRLLAPLSSAIGSWLLWQAGERLLPGRGAGLVAAALLNATLLLGAGAVTMTPDTPLLFFWVCTLWALARVCRDGGQIGSRSGMRVGGQGGVADGVPAEATGGGGAWWLAVGAFAGLALDSKYSAAFLVLGIALWLLVAGRGWLARPWPWLGLVAGLLVVAPVLWWNAAHHWVSFAKQGARIDEWRPARAAQFLGELVGSQLGLATPLVFVLCAGGLWLACRLAWRTREPAWTLLVALSLPAVVVFVEHAFADRVQGNWPAIIYPEAVIAAAGLRAPAWRRLYRPAVVLGLGITLMVYAQASLALLPVPIRFDPTALQLAGWPGLAAQVEAARQRDGASFVAADQYGVASELAYRMPGDVQVVGIDPRWRLFNRPAAKLDGRVGILVRTERRETLSAAGPWVALEPLGVVARQRDGQTVELYRLYRVTGGGRTEATVLPWR
ncbi:MAG TPA: glycosyltransferase family 39 protein [Acetobacteraceae bacterium]|nr:glycosyltransferase family 39 protein [Acetobacteraceae bacterium]